ncbi:MAG TPA: cytochrome c oxidase subunit II [Opitutae bacterium]|nr:cytochrome c oxidase subunit II [Opitutae bacterium]
MVPIFSSFIMMLVSTLKRCFVRAFLAGLSFFLLLCVSGCSFKTKQSSLDPKGPIALAQYDLFMVTVWVTLFIFVTVGGALLWVVWRFRQRPDDDDDHMPNQSHGNPLVEVGLIVASILLLVIIAVPTLRVLVYTFELPEDEGSKLGQWYQGPLTEEDAETILTVNVMGYQWWWAFEYPQLGITTANELVIPEGKVVKLNLRSADVIHSFWLPKIAGKVDLIPGRANWMWIKADEPGHYYGQCAEFCGSAHAYMLFRSDVLSHRDFEAWVEYQKKDAPEALEVSVAAGERLFAEKTCIQCHTIRGNQYAMGIKGPDLTHVASRKSLAAGIMDNRGVDGRIDRLKQRENLFEWIKNSQHIKPGNLMYHDDAGLKTVPLSDDDVHKIVAYLQTLN